MDPQPEAPLTSRSVTLVRLVSQTEIEHINRAVATHKDAVHSVAHLQRHDGGSLSLSSLPRMGSSCNHACMTDIYLHIVRAHKLSDYRHQDTMLCRL